MGKIGISSGSALLLCLCFPLFYALFGGFNTGWRYANVAKVLKSVLMIQVTNFLLVLVCNSMLEAIENKDTREKILSLK